MTDEEDVQLGPIDYLVVEWPGRQPQGEVAPELLKLVESGTIRVLDLAFITKDEDGTVSGIEIDELGEYGEEVEMFAEASSGMLDDDDLSEAAEALEPGTAAALLVYENSWAAGFASAVKRSGGQLVASGRIPTQAVLATLEALEQELEDE
ncbi:MAG: hypothetical protein KDB62_05000 [Solirubrobacterales bacterium]|nr:hypothetical protein [Solirubrobacterales bacterium]